MALCSLHSCVEHHYVGVFCVHSKAVLDALLALMSEMMSWKALGTGNTVKEPVPTAGRALLEWRLYGMFLDMPAVGVD